MIDAVVFDIGGVFTIRHPTSLRNAMARAGFALPDDDGIFHAAHYSGVRGLTEALQHQAGIEADRHFWQHFERGYFRHLGVAEHDLERAITAVGQRVYAEEPKPLWSGLLHENIAAFHRICDAGVAVAIVSNNDGTAEQQMIDFGVCQVGDGPLRRVSIVVDSGTIGIAKPDPAIFLPALEALGTLAARTLYVGDTVHADVHGAYAAGMPVVQLDPYGLHADFDHARAHGVAAIADHLLDHPRAPLRSPSVSPGTAVVNGLRS